MKPQIIAIEEHYCDPEMMAHFSACDSSKTPAIRERLDDLGDLRIKKMDEASIHPGAGARRAIDAEPGCRHRLRFGAPGQRRAARCHSIASQATGGLRRAANGRSNSCDRRIRADRHEALVQGRDGSRAHLRPMVRRSLFLANLRASAGTRRPDLIAPALPAFRRDGCLLQGLRQAAEDDHSANISAKTSTSRLAVIFPCQRCCAQSWKWDSTGSCSRSIGPMSPNLRAWTG